MITESDSPVLIDFDSALKIGESIGGIKRTYGWYNVQVEEAKVENDYTALQEIRIWLTGSSPDEFQFGP